MGRRTYWQTRRAAVPSPPLGDANRGMCPWPCRAAVSNCGKARRAYPPERRAFPLSGGREGWFLLCRGRAVTTLEDGGQTAGPRLAKGLLRRRRAGSRDRGAGPRVARSAGLRPQADRPQRARRPRPRAARSRVRRQRRAGAAREPRRLLGARRVAGGAPQRALPRAPRDRRHLSARLEGARRGTALRAARLHDLPHRPRGPRGGRRDDRRGAAVDPPRRDRRAGGDRGPAPDRQARLPDADDAFRGRHRRDRRVSSAAVSRPSRRPRRTTSATRRRTGSVP